MVERHHIEGTPAQVIAQHLISCSKNIVISKNIDKGFLFLDGLVKYGRTF